MSGLLFAAQVFAEVPTRPANSPVRNPQFLIATGLLVLVLLAGALALFLVERWRKRQLGDGADVQESAESLTSFRAMYERGELSKEEYEKVRTRMAAKIKHEVAAGQPSLARSAEPPPPPAAGSVESTGGGECTPGADSAPGPPTTSSET